MHPSKFWNLIHSSNAPTIELTFVSKYCSCTVKKIDYEQWIKQTALSDANVAQSKHGVPDGCGCLTAKLSPSFWKVLDTE